VEAGELVFGEVEASELIGLEAQQLELRLAILIAALAPIELFAQALPGIKSFGDRSGELGMTAVEIENLALARAAAQRLMLVLTMNVDEKLAQGA
jgi:hypothetical protein